MTGVADDKSSADRARWRRLRGQVVAAGRAKTRNLVRHVGALERVGGEHGEGEVRGYLSGQVGDHASALQRVCSITRRTRLMRSQGCQRRASVLFTSPALARDGGCRESSVVIRFAIQRRLQVVYRDTKYFAELPPV